MNAPYILLHEEAFTASSVSPELLRDNGYDIDLKLVPQPQQVLNHLLTCVDTKQQLPSLIILDKDISSGNGLSLLKEIKQHRSLRAIPIVMIGNTINEDVQKSYEEGASSFVEASVIGEAGSESFNSFFKYWLDTVELPLLAHTVVK